MNSNIGYDKKLSALESLEKLNNKFGGDFTDVKYLRLGGSYAVYNVDLSQGESAVLFCISGEWDLVFTASSDGTRDYYYLYDDFGNMEYFEVGSDSITIRRFYPCKVYLTRAIES